MTLCMQAAPQMFDGPMPERVSFGANAGSSTSPSGLAFATVQQPGTQLSMAVQLSLTAWADWADFQQASGEQRPTVRVHNCQDDKRGTRRLCMPSTKPT